MPDATGSTREAGSGAAQGSAAGRGVKAAWTRGAGLRLARLSTLSTVAPTTRGLSNPFMVQGPSVIVTSKTAHRLPRRYPRLHSPSLLLAQESSAPRQGTRARNGLRPSRALDASGLDPEGLAHPVEKHCVPMLGRHRLVVELRPLRHREPGQGLR